MSSNPLISVLFPVYNTEKYLEESLYSLLNQSYKNIEIIAINDGSTDGSLKLLRSIADKDPRVIIVNQENKGLVKTLNFGASIAKGEYIARMDSDDLSLPHRFSEQLELLHDPEVVLVAGTFEVIDDDGEFIYREVVPCDDYSIKRAMYVRNPIAHGSVMFRKDAFIKTGGYSETCGPTEDYELWTRMASLGKFAGLENTIFRWRVNPSGITSTKTQLVEKYMLQNIEAYWGMNPVSIPTRKELVERGNHYLKRYKKHGVSMKIRTSSDETQLAVKLIRRKRFRLGFLLFARIASTGRTGLKLIYKKLFVITLNLIRNRGLEQKQTLLAIDPTKKIKDEISSS